MNLPSHELTMTVLMTPDMANFTGNVHGGTILKLLDQVAYAFASRYSGRYVVTLSVDQVTFRQPIHVGELVTFLASVNYTGTTSMEVGIKARTSRRRPSATPTAASSRWWRWTTGAVPLPCRPSCRSPKTRSAATMPPAPGASCDRNSSSA